MEAQFAAAPDMTVSWTTTDVRVAASGDMAVETGTWTFDTDGDGEAVPTNGEFVTVWVKTDGAWRAVADAGTQQKAVEPAEPGAGAAT
jgi:ketosteroid isomerase-like protein